MPVPGEPRNPDHVRRFTRFHRNRLLLAGRNQDRRLRSTQQEPGTIRRLWASEAGYQAAMPPFSWTANRFESGPLPPVSAVTTCVRYMISTMNVLTAGNQRSMPFKRPALPPRVAHTPPSLVMAGNVGYRPTVRSRVPSFGSRVPALNSPGIPGTEG